MKHLNQVLIITLVAGSLGLAGLGIARANAADTSITTSDVDTAVRATTTATTTLPIEGRGRHGGWMLTDRATEFNMSVTDLQKELDAGKPMYQIATEHGVTYATEQAQHLADLKTRLDDMVKVKYMTQAEADAAYSAAQANPMVGMGRGSGGHGMMR